MHWATQSELKPICAMRTLWSRNSRSRTFGRVIAVFFLLRRFNNNKKNVCVCFSCLFILQHNCGLNTISMRHRNEIEERLLFGGCNGLLIRPSNKYMTTAALHSDQQQQPGCAIATVLTIFGAIFFFLIYFIPSILRSVFVGCVYFYCSSHYFQHS